MTDCRVGGKRERFLEPSTAPRGWTVLWGGRLLNGMAALSAVLLAVMLAIWGRTFFRVDGIIYQPRIENVLHQYSVAWGRGVVYVRVQAAEPSATSRLYWWSYVPKGRVVFPLKPNEFYFMGV